MQYRRFGKLDWRVSALGFGAMRLPTVGGDTNKVDEAEAIRLIRYAIDQGVNYVDTAYTYHGGNSERVVGKALQDGYRERAELVTKMPTWLTKTAGDFDRYFEEQMERLQTDHLDFYLLHSLDGARWRELQRIGVLNWAERQMAAGRIGHLGFSFHDVFDSFKEIVDAYDNWTLAQIYYNFLSEERQAGTRGLNYAAARGLAVVVMGPVNGGLLSANPPAAVQALWEGAGRQRKPVDWALQWVWDHDGVSVALSGMSGMDQLRENLASADASRPGGLTPEELALVAQVRDIYHALRPIPCSECKYCQPCPNNVAIPDIFGYYNTVFMHNAVDYSRHCYGSLVKDNQGADRCLQCGECESICPQQIHIMEWLPKVHELLG